MEKSNYKKFGLMMLVSFIIMYAIMFTNVDVINHIKLSNTRTYMTLLMVAPMAISMLLFMGGMYKSKKINAIILSAAGLVLIGSFFMLRNQTFISDIQYMKAMVPHHSSAIMTSQNAHLKDPEVKKLAEDIIAAQKREIAQMEAAIKRLEAKN